MDKSFIDLFEDQVAKTPDNIAVVFESEKITYRELDERSNRLASHLQSQRTTKDALVPLFIERGINMIVGMLGIMKAGCAYVPIDTDFPQDRIHFILNDTKAFIAVSSKQKRHHLPAVAGLDVVEIEVISNDQHLDFKSEVTAQHLAYVIYTSGSTGKPKGVMVEQGNLTDYISGLNNKVQLDNCKSFALVSSIATDLGNTVIYGALATGGALHLFSKESVNNTDYLHKYFKQQAVECLKIVPSHWKALNNNDQLLLPTKLIIFGGEALSEKIVESINSVNSDCQIINHYGPTETTIGKLLHIVQPGIKYEATVPIGKPFSNTKVLILNSGLKLCPIGVPGQLYITGDGLARGYLHNEELTKQKFTRNPFVKDNSSLMYATGDLVKYLSDGNIQFLGRVDDQVKIRGYRVELGEIESVILESELVKQAVVLGLDDKQGNKRLVAYIVGDEDFDREDLLSYLKEKLPDYMVPSIIIDLESLPLAPNGKVDRKSLPDPGQAEQKSDEYIAPRNATEAQLAEIWQDILEVDQVGVDDDFFVLGGHSLLAVRLISSIRKAFQAELPISDVFDYPTVAALATRLEIQQSAGGTATVLLPAVGVQIRPAQIPLSFSQERLWFIDQMEGSVQYHVPAVLKLKGKLNASALKKALGEIVSRHEVLRTMIYQENGQAWQKVQASPENLLIEIDSRKYTDDFLALKSCIKELISVPFDLSKDIKLRAHLLTITEDEYIFIVTLHHIASDGWSRSILVSELVELYTAFTTGRRVNLPVLLAQYADYAIWQRSYLEGEVLLSKLHYWKEKLKNVSPLELPTDHVRPAVQSNRGSLFYFTVNQELAKALQDLSHRQGVTLYMTLLSAFKVLLYRYSGQEDICVGSPIAGRQQQELEGLIGFFVNTLVLRSQVDGQSSFTNLLQSVKATTLEAYAHQEIPFEKVVEAVASERNLSRNPLFQVMFILRNTPDVPELRLGDVELSRAGHEHTTSLFDLSLFLTETETGLLGAIEYSTDLYTDETIERMAGHLQTLLAAVVNNPAETIGLFKMSDIREEKRLLIEFNDTDKTYQENKTVNHLFAEQVKRNPEAYALAYDDKYITYKELDELSDKLAYCLCHKGVSNETLVPVCMNRSPELIVSLLGIIKAGAAYVPIDPDYPEDRINFILKDIGATLLLVCDSIITSRMKSAMIEIVDLKLNKDTIFDESFSFIQPLTDSNNLAYVIYTSGSTGRPKGVMIEHASLTNLIEWHKEEFEISEESRATTMAGVGFDALGWEIWPYLSSGATIHIIDNETRLQPAKLSEFFVQKHITHTFISTAVIPQCISQFRDRKSSLKYMLTGGDKLPSLDLSEISFTIINNYGPTENTVVATSCRVLSSHSIPPIGKPIANTQITILNQYKQLVPQGAVGEICISGKQVARGYLNRHDLTEEQFIDNPFKEHGYSTLYKTGDLGRWLSDGNIEYLGRVDEQVKIRGYRIEPGEIENVVLQSGKVKQAVVVAQPDGRGSKRLVGYVVGEEGFSKAELNQHLSERLPEYMIPAIWMELHSIPLTANGKTDKQALPEIDISQELKQGYVAPETEFERKLASIWRELLGVERVGLNDNFFELGGHSLMAMRIVSYIEKDLLVTIPIKLLFQLTTLKDLSKYIEIQTNTNSEEKSAGTFTVLDV
jgi:amino acid adenylation domain-containing protein